MGLIELGPLSLLSVEPGVWPLVVVDLAVSLLFVAGLKVLTLLLFVFTFVLAVDFLIECFVVLLFILGLLVFVFLLIALFVVE